MTNNRLIWCLETERKMGDRQLDSSEQRNSIDVISKETTKSSTNLGEKGKLQQFFYIEKYLPRHIDCKQFKNKDECWKSSGS